MDPRDFCQQAEEFAEGKPAANFGNRAVDCRSSISRAYYACYNVAISFLTSMSIPVRRGPGAHREVQLFLENSGDSDIRNIGSELEDMREMRNVADYDLERTDVETRHSARFHASKARAVIQVIDSCTSQSRRSQIAASILAYRKDVLRLP
ncbi:MAG TPA: hypothetical protein VM223_13380 [Planctomycetota bacterium]|nr:hypothetical protein [Planctomycetota bacterium]